MPADEQGVNFDRYMFVPRTLIFLFRGTSILLIKGSKTKRLWPGLYNGIGGHVEQGEDLLLAAHRELKEETGLESSDLFLCGIVIVDTQRNPGVCIYVFNGSPSAGELNSSEEGSLEWVEISELDQVPQVPDLPILLPKIIQSKANERPFLAYSRYDADGNIQINFG